MYVVMMSLHYCDVDNRSSYNILIYIMQKTLKCIKLGAPVLQVKTFRDIIPPNVYVEWTVQGLDCMIKKIDMFFLQLLILFVLCLSFDKSKRQLHIVFPLTLCSKVGWYLICHQSDIVDKNQFLHRFDTV